MSSYSRMYVVPQDKYDAFISGSCRGDVKYTRQINQLDVNEGGKVIIRNDDNVKNINSATSSSSFSPKPPAKNISSASGINNKQQLNQSENLHDMSNISESNSDISMMNISEQSNSPASNNKNVNMTRIPPAPPLPTNLLPSSPIQNKKKNLKTPASTPISGNYSIPKDLFENANQSSEDIYQTPPAVMSQNPPRIFTPMSELVSNIYQPSFSEKIRPLINQSSSLENEKNKMNPQNSVISEDSAMLDQLPESFFKNAPLRDMNDVINWTQSRDKSNDIFMEPGDQSTSKHTRKNTNPRTSNKASNFKRKIASKKRSNISVTRQKKGVKSTKKMKMKLASKDPINQDNTSQASANKNGQSEVAIYSSGADNSNGNFLGGNDILPLPRMINNSDNVTPQIALPSGPSNLNEIKNITLPDVLRKKSRSIENSELSERYLRAKNRRKEREKDYNEKRGPRVVKVIAPVAQNVISEIPRNRKRSSSPEFAVRFSKEINPIKKNKQDKNDEYKSWIVKM